jgi:hypothetical protein
VSECDLLREALAQLEKLRALGQKLGRLWQLQPISMPVRDVRQCSACTFSSHVYRRACAFESELSCLQLRLRLCARPLAGAQPNLAGEDTAGANRYYQSNIGMNLISARALAPE